MLKLDELVNYHSSEGGVFEMASDRGGRIETLHWSGSFSSLFIEKYSDFILIDGTHNTNLYDLSLVVTTMVDSLGVSIPAGFLVTLSENLSSIESHLDLLRIDSNPSHDLYGGIYYSMMTDEGLASVEVVSSMSGYYHCMCSFHVNQLTVRVSLLMLFAVVDSLSFILIFNLTSINVTNKVKSHFVVIDF